MADRPHRAIILYGDGLLIDAEQQWENLPSGSTTIDDANCPALHLSARRGICGFLALRSLPEIENEGERLTRDLGQLLDLHDALAAANSDSRLRDIQTGNNIAVTASSGEQTFPSISSRFMNMSGTMFTNSRCAAKFGELAGFSLVPLHPVPSSSSVDHKTQDPNTDYLANAKPAELADRMLALLGLDQPEEPGPPPSAAESLEGQVDLVLAHLHNEELLVHPVSESADGIKRQNVHHMGEEQLRGTSEVNTQISPTGSGTELCNPVLDLETDLPSSRHVDAGDDETGHRQRRWHTAVRGLEWLDAVVAALLARAALSTRVSEHMFLIVVLGYGAVPDDSSRGLQHQGLPGWQALASVGNEEDARFAKCRPRQSYQLKQDEVVTNVREHHPLLVTQLLPAVTRQDACSKLGVEECRKHGGNLTILADNFIHEVAFKLWRAPKYGA